MSIKSFHIAFIVTSTALCVYLAAWGFNDYRATDSGQSLGLLISGLLGLLALIPYALWVQKKFKKIALTLALGLSGLLFESSDALACSVCFGDPNSVMTKGIKAGIILLIIVVGVVLGGIATVGLSWVKRARQIES